MKLIIDIAEDIYNGVITDDCFNGYDICKVKEAIQNGIPLEKLINTLEERRSELVDVYGDLGGAVSGLIKLIERTYKGE